MKAIILAAGSGSNLNPFNNTRPKPMINVGGVYILENTLSLLKRAGIRDSIVVVGHKKEKITDHFKGSLSKEISIHYESQEKLFGIGEALLLTQNRFSPGEYFLLIYGDVVTSENIYSTILQSFHTFRSPVASICLPPHSSLFGNIFLSSQMDITKIIEKPHKDSLGNYVLSGVFILNTNFFDLLKKVNGSMEKALAELAEKGELKASIWEGDWIDLGCPWDILTANKIIMDSWENSIISKTARLESNVTINGIVRIDDDVTIKAGVILEGPCHIGKGSYIGSNTLVRSYTSLGEKTITGYGAEIKNSVMFANSQIGRLSFIGDSVIGENVDIGTGTVTVNRRLDFSPIWVKFGNEERDTHLVKLGSFIGDNVTIGASNTLMPGTIIDPDTIIPSCYSYPKK